MLAIDLLTGLFALRSRLRSVRVLRAGLTTEGVP